MERKEEDRAVEREREEETGKEGEGDNVQRKGGTGRWC